MFSPDDASFDVMGTIIRMGNDMHREEKKQMLLVWMCHPM